MKKKQDKIYSTKDKAKMIEETPIVIRVDVGGAMLLGFALFQFSKKSNHESLPKIAEDFAELLLILVSEIEDTSVKSLVNRTITMVGGVEKTDE